jgi:hypothetical protein
MRPDDDREGVLAVLRLVAEELGVTYDGEDLSLRMGWSKERGSNRTKKVRNWVNGKPPGQFGDLLDMLSEAGLLAASAEAAWLGSESPQLTPEALRRRAAPFEREPPTRGRKRGAR